MSAGLTLMRAFFIFTENSIHAGKHSSGTLQTDQGGNRVADRRWPRGIFIHPFLSALPFRFRGL